LTQLETAKEALSPQGLKRQFQATARKAVETAVISFREAFDEWIEVHRGQLKALRISVLEANASVWTSGLQSLLQRLASDYASPLLTFTLDLSRATGLVYPPDMTQRTPQVAVIPREIQREDIVERLNEYQKPGKTVTYFQENRSNLSPELLQLWDSQQFHTLSLHNSSKEADLLALSLLLVRSTSTKVVTLSHCHYPAQSLLCLSQAFKRTRCCLKVVDISCNTMDEAAFQTLLEAIREREICILGVRDLGLTDAILPSLVALGNVKLDAVGNRFSLPGKVTLMGLNPENKV
jgi:hypothetical protein